MMSDESNKIPLVNTIAFKSLAVFALVFFVTLVGGGIFLTANQAKETEDNARKDIRQFTEQAGDLIYSNYKMFLDRLSLLATTPYIENQDPDESGSFLKGYNVAPLFIPGEHIALYNSKREKISDNSMVGIVRMGDSYQELKNFDAVEPQRPYISPLFWEQHTPKKIIAVLVENRAKASGYLAASFSFRRLWEIFEEYKLGKTGYFVVIDESDVIVYHPNIRKWANGSKKAQDLGLRNFNARTFKPQSQYYKLEDGKQYLIDYEYDTQTKLGVLSFLPKEEVEVSTHAFRNLFIYIAIIFLIAISGITFWFFRNIEKPIQNLINTMLIISNGNYEVSSGISGVKNNEIHILARVFDKMRLTIREKMAALAENQALLEHEVYKRTEELAKANDQLKMISRTDELTKLPNRRDIREKIFYEISRYERTRRKFSFLFADIDKFKDFNDKFGHICGDLVLKTVATTLQKHLRKQDVVSRWGGEEFLTLLPETPLAGAALVAERLRKSIEDTEIEFGGTKLHITITIGVAEFDERLGMDHSINLADNALYRGKQSGRNKVSIFDPKDITEEDLKAAQAEMQFVNNAEK